MWVSCSFWNIKYQGIYNITILYISKILKNTFGLFPFEFISRVGIDDSVAVMVCVFMALSLQRLCLFVLTDPSGEKLFPGLLKMSVSHVAYLFLLNFEWVVHGDGNHNWASSKCIQESPKLLLIVLLTCICELSPLRRILCITDGSLQRAVWCKTFCSPQSPSLSLAIAMCGNMCLSLGTGN